MTTRTLRSRTRPAACLAGLAVGLTAVLGAAPAAAAPDRPAPAYVLTELGPLEGGTSSIALGVAANGTAVGTSRTGTSARPQVAVRWRDGEITSLGTLPGSTFSRAFAVNSRGQAVGEAFTPSPEVSRAVLWEADGTLRDLGTLGGASAVANDVDERGRAFGVSSQERGPVVATVWDRTGPQALPAPDPTVTGASRVNAVTRSGTAVGAAPGRTATTPSSTAVRWVPRGQAFVATALDRLEADRFATAFGVSERGTAVGEATRTDSADPSRTVTRAVRWDGTAVAELPGVRSYRFTRANDVASTGEVVGFASGFAGFPSIDGTAVLWRDGRAIDLNTVTTGLAGLVLRNAEAVNEQGQIVGFGTRNGQNVAVRLDPVRR